MEARADGGARRGLAARGWPLSKLRSLVAEELPGISTMRAVASLKADHPIALADCFAIAVAAANGAELLTGDPEIIERADDLPCAVTDPRGSGA